MFESMLQVEIMEVSVFGCAKNVVLTIAEQNLQSLRNPSSVSAFRRPLMEFFSPTLLDSFIRSSRLCAVERFGFGWWRTECFGIGFESQEALRDFQIGVLSLESRNYTVDRIEQ
jgi:hypothetical protein